MMKWYLFGKIVEIKQEYYTLIFDTKVLREIQILTHSVSVLKPNLDWFPKLYRSSYNTRLY